MRLLLNSIILLLFLIISCDEQSKEDVIDVGFTTSIDPLVELVSSIEIIPLETDSVHIIGSQKDLIVSDDSYIISDASNGNIFRYSLDGRYIATYFSVTDAQEAIGYKGGGINKCCLHRPKYYSAGGFKWEYDEDWRRNKV